MDTELIEEVWVKGYLENIFITILNNRITTTKKLPQNLQNS